MFVLFRLSWHEKQHVTAAKWTNKLIEAAFPAGVLLSSELLGYLHPLVQMHSVPFFEKHNANEVTTFMS